jgi:hypothetical protein
LIIPFMKGRKRQKNKSPACEGLKKMDNSFDQKAFTF